jgi:HD-GYP domain-containing protein (c-di-GMP phosphodiesterase class II)
MRNEVPAKPGPLTPEEWMAMEKHTLIGEQILAPLDFMCPALPVVRHEHERWDGKGYPGGLAGDEIALDARIILVCDAFHAMTSDRPYRDALPHEEAVRCLRGGAGAQFDPAVVETFLSVLERLADGGAMAPLPALSGAARPAGRDWRPRTARSS